MPTADLASATVAVVGPLLASHTRSAPVPLLVLVGAAFLVAAWNGLRVWRGELRPAYGSLWGAGYAAVPIGVGFAVLAFGEATRGLLDLSEDGAMWWTVSVVGFLPVVVGGLFVLAYQLVGVPDALRPPYQRGLRRSEPPPPHVAPVTAEAASAVPASGDLHVTRLRGRMPILTLTDDELVVHRRRGAITLPHAHVADAYVARGPNPTTGRGELVVELLPGQQVSTFTDRPGRSTDLDLRPHWTRPDGTHPDGAIVTMGPGRLDPPAEVVADAIRARLGLPR